MPKVLFVIKDEEVISILDESLHMILPESYDYILWLPKETWFGNHVRFMVDRKVEILSDLNPKKYKYDKNEWDIFKEKIKQ